MMLCRQMAAKSTTVDVLQHHEANGGSGAVREKWIEWKMTRHQAGLRMIPLIEGPANHPERLINQAQHQFEALLECGRRSHGRLVMRIGDAVARRWLKKANNPFREEIEQVAERASADGAVMLNLSYEFSCSTSVAADPERAGNRMLRTLDWPLSGLGENVVVARVDAPAGPYYSVTWPGSVGVLTAMAPGRFSAAINQPPLDRVVGSCWIDWLMTRPAVWRSTALPAAHLLRRVFDTCETFDDAKRLLVETPIAVPAFFSLSGAAAEQGCIIERTATSAAVHDSSACITNHWLKTNRRGHNRGTDSTGRLARLQSIHATAANDFEWVAPPILNDTTRLAVVANAHESVLLVQGWERGAPATEPFDLSRHFEGETPKHQTTQLSASQS